MNYAQLISDLHLIESDVKRLPSVTFTYCNDSGTATSWIDHFLCCNRIDNLIEKIDIHLSFVTSDHKPLQLTLRNIGAPDTVTQTPVNINGNDNAVLFMTDWSNCVDADFHCYNYALDTELHRINIPIKSYLRYRMFKSYMVPHLLGTLYSLYLMIIIILLCHV